MKLAFIDTSALAAILFREPSSGAVQNILEDLDKVYASNLLEAEIRSAAARECVAQQEVDGVLGKVKWVLPERPLSQELRVVAACGKPLRGADAWHLASALFMAGDPANLPFVTLDQNQAEAAASLGFQVLPGIPRADGGLHEAPVVYRAGKPRPKRRK